MKVIKIIIQIDNKYKLILNIFENKNEVIQDTSNFDYSSPAPNKKGGDKIKKVNKMFNELMIKAINEFRENPTKLVPAIKEIIPFLRKPSESKIVVEKEGCPKVVLIKGESLILECIDIISKLEELPKFEYKKELEIKIPKDKDFISVQQELFEYKKNELKDKYDYFAYHYDIGISSPDYSLLFQIIDDNVLSGIRRANLINRKLKYIAVSHKLINKKFYSCFMFAG